MLIQEEWDEFEFGAWTPVAGVVSLQHFSL